MTVLQNISIFSQFKLITYFLRPRVCWAMHVEVTECKVIAMVEIGHSNCKMVTMVENCLRWLKIAYNG